MATYYFRNTGDVNWGTASNWSLTDGGGATGAVPTAADDAYFTSNSGNCTINTSARVCKTLVFSGVGAGNYAGTLTMTNGITVSGNVTLSATMTIAGASGLTVNAAASLNFNGKTWPNAFVFITGSFTVTLLSDLNITGSITFNANVTLNGTFNINCSGGIIMGANAIKGTGTPTLNLLGGTWSNSGTLAIDTNINGNVTIGTSAVFSGATLTRLSGTVTTTGSTFFVNATISTPTLNVSGITWNNVNISQTITITSDLNVGGLFTMAGSNVTITGTYNINLYGGLSIAAGLRLLQGTGTTTVNLYGGTWSGSGRLSLNTNINGNITVSGSVGYDTGTLTYTAITVKANTATLTISANSTFINCDKINFKTITITAGTTQTFNKFFSGSAIQPTRVQSSLTTSNYTIAFTDNFEKITKFTKISNCTVTNRSQLLCLTNNSNKGGNIGIRYFNQLPNGVPKNAPTVAAAMAYSVANISDPNFILN